MAISPFASNSSVLFERRPTLDEHVLRAVSEAVLAGVVGERDVGVGLDALQLAPEPERRRERDGARVAVVQPDRRDGADDHATGRREVAERGRDVAADDLVLAIVPVHDGPLAP